jgi:putative ABC transport system ATP-binding protein
LIGDIRRRASPDAPRASGQAPMLELSGIAKSFGGPAPRELFRDLSLRVERGEYVAIVGASGVGKSTLLNVIAGLEPIDAGRVTIDGVDWVLLDDDARTTLRRDRLGFVFQAFHVLPYLSVAQNVALPLALKGEAGSDVDTKVRAILDAVGLAGREASMPRELSGGELQRVAIARALVHAPSLVLADEPTGNLDPKTAREVVALFRDAVKTRGAAAVLATHSRAVAASADRVYRLSADGLTEAGADDVE